MVDPEAIRSSNPQDWEKVGEFAASGNVYWLHTPTSTFMAVKSSSAHPTSAEPVSEYALLCEEGEIRIEILDANSIRISVPLLNDSYTLEVNLDEALWLSANTYLVIETIQTQPAATSIYKAVHST